MPRYRSGLIWFDDDEFIGAEVTFPQPTPSRWRLDRKICEQESTEVEEDANHPGCASEARAVYQCSNLDGSTPQEAIIKIRMQYFPLNLSDERLSVVLMGMQGTVSIHLHQTTLYASEAGHRNRCSSAPALLAWKQEKQDDELLVPGGYIVYILMERLPGIMVNRFYHDLSRGERDEMRKCFKDAWLDCKQSGIINMDTAIRNLLWDAEGKKCYILDFDFARIPDERDTWYDMLYISWNLAWVNEGNHDDISTWEL